VRKVFFGREGREGKGDGQIIYKLRAGWIKGGKGKKKERGKERTWEEEVRRNDEEEEERKDRRQ
jgi:hypothetical protein